MRAAIDVRRRCGAFRLVLPVRQGGFERRNGMMLLALQAGRRWWWLLRRARSVFVARGRRGAACKRRSFGSVCGHQAHLRTANQKHLCVHVLYQIFYLWPPCLPVPFPTYLN